MVDLFFRIRVVDRKYGRSLSKIRPDADGP